MKRERVKSIEIWRLIFTVSIVFNHSMVLPYYAEGRGYLWMTSMGVEFFFLLSGYLMAAKAVSSAPPPIGKSWKFHIRHWPGYVAIPLG